jgi:magnesium transporter
MAEPKDHTAPQPGAEPSSRPPEPEVTGVDEARERSPEDQRVAELLAQTIDVPVLAEAVELQQAADAADTLEALEEEEAADVLVAMDDQAAAQALAEMENPLAAMVLRDLLDEGNAEFAGRMVDLMAPDDAADLLQTMDKGSQEEVYKAMPALEAVKLRRLAGYAEDTAAGLMTTEFVVLRDDMTVRDATATIRASRIPEEVHHLPVVDEGGHLTGVVGLRALLLSSADRHIADLMVRDTKAVRADLDREAVAMEFDRYDYFMMPVIDRADRLLGIVTVDDVIDIIRREHTEDVQKTVGAGAGEAVYSGLGEKFRGRLPWLLVNLFTSSVAAMIVLRFEPLVAELAILAVLMPVIANQAGNAGQQSLAVTLRGIVLGEVRRGRVFPLIFREALIGMINGLLAGLLVCLAVTVLGMFGGGPGLRLGIVAAFSMCIALTVGCLTGCSMPLLMHRLGRDPATASTIFLTMVTDSFSFLAFLGTARLLSGWMGVGG